MTGRITVKTGSRVEVGSGSLINAGTGVTPLVIPNLAGHWDFSDISTLFLDTARTMPVTSNLDIVRGVTDKSGGGNHLDDGGADGMNFRTNVKNGLSTVENIGSTNKYLDEGGLDLTLGSPFSIFFVAKTPSSQVENFQSTGLGADVDANSVQMGSCANVSNCGTRYFDGTTSTDSVVDAVFAADVWHIWVMDMDGVNNPTYIENAFDVNLTAGALTFTGGIRIGHDSNTGFGQWNSHIGEIYAIDGALSSATRIALVNSLKTKWAI